MRSATEHAPSARLAVMSEAVAPLCFGEALRTLADHGVTATEATAGPGGHLPAQQSPAVREARRVLDGSGVAIFGVAASVGLPLGHDRLAGVLDVADELGAAIVRIYAPPYRADAGAESQLDAVTSMLGALRARSPERLELLIEPAPGTVIPSPELARRVLVASGLTRVGVVYDPANMITEGHLQSPYATELLGAYVRHVHVKNHVFARSNGTWLPTPAPLDRGLVDWPATIAALACVGYGGRFSIDHLSGPPTPERLGVDLRTLRMLVGNSPLLEPATP